MLRRHNFRFRRFFNRHKNLMKFFLFFHSLHRDFQFLFDTFFFAPLNSFNPLRVTNLLFQHMISLKLPK